jgi:thiosulfate reductase cytochrome b subunit
MSEMTADGLAAETRTRRNKAGEKVIYRHTLWVRSWHWVNALSLLVLLMSGLQIFNAHPSLDWGMTTNFDRPWVSLEGQEVGGKLVGVTRIGPLSFQTTGVLGVSAGVDGQPQERGFPKWATLPGLRDLGTGRHWHFLAAWLFVLNGIFFVGYTIWSRHLTKDLWPSVADLKSIPASIWEHMQLKHPEGDAAARYNVLQKLAYLIVLYGLLPMMLFTGLTMSPGMDAASPGLLWVFGGRQSARTLHFLSAFGLVLFFLIHIFEVIAAGAINEMRSILTGWFTIKAPHTTAVVAGPACEIPAASATSHEGAGE